MKCPYCGYKEDKVVDSRATAEESAVRRRRECLKCGKRFTTYERVEGPQLTVVKKDSSRQSFDREKIRRGIVKACEKRPVGNDLIEAVIDEVEQEMMKKPSGEVFSRTIGNAVLRRLKKTDKVAYVRFASVYLDFNEIDDFVQLVKEIK